MSVTGAKPSPSLERKQAFVEPLALEEGSSPRSDQDVQTGTFNGRAVVVGVTSLFHRVTASSRLNWTSAVGVLGGAVLGYAYASDFAVDDTEQYHGYRTYLENAASTLVGAVVGYGLPRVAARVWDAIERRSEKRHLQQDGHNDSKYQLGRVVHHAKTTAPLTMDGLRQKVQQIKELRTARGDISHGDVAKTIAQLGSIVPNLERSCCSRGTSRDNPEFNYLLAEINTLHKSNLITRSELKDALIALAHNLRQPLFTDAELTRFATGLCATYRQASKTSDSKDDAMLGDRADFMLQLCEAPCFKRHSDIVFKQADQQLGCNQGAYRAALPVPPRATAAASDSKSQATVTGATALVNKLLQTKWTEAAKLTQALNELVVELGKGPSNLADSKLADLDEWLSNIKTRDAGLNNAIERTKFFAHYGPGACDQVTREYASSGVADVNLWKDAPCGVLEALSYLTAQSPKNKVLAELCSTVTTPAFIKASLERASFDDLKAEVAMAIGIAMQAGRTPFETAQYLVTILTALEQKKDLPTGAFLEGLLPPETVTQLITKLAKAKAPDGVNKAELIASLPKLCQLQATNELLNSAVDSLAGTQIAHATQKVDERIVKSGSSTSLHLSFRSDRELTINDFKRSE